MYPDIAGLRPLFDDLAARLATDHRWAVAVVELFPGQDLPTIDARFDAVAHLEDERVISDGVLAADELAQRAGVAHVAVMGFCLGGMYAYKAVRSRRYDRGVSFYGMIRVPVAWRGGGQSEPLEAVSEATACPVLAIIGEADPYTPDEDVSSLQGAGPHVSVVRYPGAEHGFVHDPERPAHRPDDAADAWRRVVAFLATE
jgi:carboxymethylenebutenolidase